MSYIEITSYNSPNKTAGRQGKNIDKIVIHWWGNPSGQTLEGVCGWLCNPRSQVSAHAVVSGNRVAWLVDCADTAWHAGDWQANITSVGIECDPRARDEDYETISELVADLWRAYGRLPLYPHRHFFNTSCPGVYDLSRIEALAVAKFNGQTASNQTQTEQIKQAYREILEREADAGGINHYLELIKQGWSIDRVRGDLIDSNERKQLEARKHQEWEAEQARKHAENLKLIEEQKRREAEELKAQTVLNKQPESDTLKENNSLLKQILNLLKRIFRL